MKEEGAQEIPKLRGFGDSLQGYLGVVLQLMPGLVRKFPLNSVGWGMLLNPTIIPASLLKQKAQFLGEQALFSPSLGKVELQHLHSVRGWSKSNKNPSSGHI